MAKTNAASFEVDDNSWIIDDQSESTFDDADEDYELEESQVVVSRPSLPATPNKHIRRRVPGTASMMNLSPEPQFVMPRMHVKEQPPRPAAMSAAASPRPRKAQAPRNTTQRQDLSQAPGVATDNYVSNLFWSEVLLPIMRFFASVISGTLSYARPMISVVLFLWVLSYFITNFLSPYISANIFAPVCSIPFASTIIPQCTMLDFPASGSPEFATLMNVQGNFEAMLESSMSTLDLPLDMKHSESSIRDLRTAVKWSTLPSKNELVHELSSFIDSARSASNDLLKFNSHIGRAVDRVIVTNRWTLRTLDGLKEDTTSDSIFTGLIPFYSSPKTSERLVLAQYIRHANAIEEQIDSLIIEAQALLMLLQSLDERLDLIDTIASRDGATAKLNRDDLLAQLWTWVGGNRSSMKKNTEQLTLLKNVKIYLKAAFEHVSITVLALQKIGLGLEDLRERLAAPDVGRSDSSISGEDTPLSVHIESIELALERLVTQRDLGKGVGEQRIKQVIDSGAGEIKKGRLEIERS